MSTRIPSLPPLDIASPPPFQPQSFDDPALAVEALTALYERNTAFLIDHFAELAKGAPIKSRYRAFYPQVSIETTSFGHVGLAPLLWACHGAWRLYDDHYPAAALQVLSQSAAGAAAQQPQRSDRGVGIVHADPAAFRLWRRCPCGSVGQRLRRRAAARYLRHAGPQHDRRRDRQRRIYPAAGPALAARRLHRAAHRLFARPPCALHRDQRRSFPEFRAVHELPVLYRRVLHLGPRR